MKKNTQELEKKNVNRQSLPFLPVSCYFKSRWCLDDVGDAKTSKQPTSIKDLGIPRAKITSYEFDGCADSFNKIMLLLLEYTRQVGSVASMTSDSNRVLMYSVLEELIFNAKTKGDRVGEVILGFKGDSADEKNILEKSFNVYDPNLLHRLNEMMEKYREAEHILADSAIQQFVNSWEYHLANLIKMYYVYNPEKLDETMTLTYKQITDANDIAHMQMLLVDRVVRAFLNKRDPDEMVPCLQKEFGIDFYGQFPEMKKLSEIVLRRHLIVHAGGIANKEYIDLVRKLKMEGSLPVDGERVESSVGYVLNAWDIIYSAGMIAYHLIAISYAQKKANVEAEESADSQVAEAAFYALKANRPYAAKIILEYIAKRSMKDVESVLQSKLNLALVYKTIGQENQCSKVLSQYNWNSTSDKFRICVYALKEDVKEVFRLLRKMVMEKPSYISNVYEWPIYQWIRRAPQFEEEMKKLEEECQKLTCKRGPTECKVLDFNMSSANVEEKIMTLFKKALGVAEGKGSEDCIAGRGVQVLAAQDGARNRHSCKTAARKRKKN